MVLEAVFVLVLWNGHAPAGVNYFTKTEHVSNHATEAECQTALLGYGKRWEASATVEETRSPIMSCEKATRLSLKGTKPKPQTWGEWWRSH